MERNPPNENTARVLAVALVFFGSLAAVGYASGVFERLGSETVIALAAFAIAFAVLTYRLDPSVRGFVGRLVAPRRAPRERAAGRAAAVQATGR